MTGNLKKTKQIKPYTKQQQQKSQSKLEDRVSSQAVLSILVSDISPFFPLPLWKHSMETELTPPPSALHPITFHPPPRLPDASQSPHKTPKHILLVNCTARTNMTGS